MDEKIKTLATREELKTSATKTELKVEQDKIVKFQTSDLTLFIGQGYFVNDGVQLYLIFQPLYYTLERLSNTEEVVSWKSKGLLTKKRDTPITNANSLSLTIKWYGDSNFCLIFKGNKETQLLLLQIE